MVKKISKDIEESNDMINSLTDTLEQRTQNNRTHSFQAYGTFTKIDLLLGHKTTLSRFQKLKSYRV